MNNNEKIIKGKEGGSRFAKIAARALGITAQTDGRPFNDTSDQYVHALYDYNIITGYEDGTFRPKNRLTRAELTAIVWRILELRS